VQSALPLLRKLRRLCALLVFPLVCLGEGEGEEEGQEVEEEKGDGQGKG